MTGQKTFHREKRVVLSPQDELAYSRVLRENFPGAMFAEDDYQGHASNFRIIPSIAHSTSDRIQFFIPSPGQEQRMKINKDFGQILVQPNCRFRYDRSHWEHFHDPSKKFAFDSPLLGWGSLTSSFPADDEMNKKFAAKVLRLVNKVCGVIPIGYDAMRISFEGGKRCAVGIGTHINECKPYEHLSYYQDELWDDDAANITPLPESQGFRQ